VTAGDLLPWLVGLYALEAATYVRRGEVVLVGLPFRPFEVATQGLCVRAFLPQAEVLRADEFPLVVTDEGIWRSADRYDDAERDPNGEAEFREFGALNVLAVSNRSVTANDRVLVTMASPEGAARVHGLLANLRHLELHSRGHALEAWLARRFDLAAARALRARVRSAVTWLRTIGVLLFLTVFVVVPLSLSSSTAGFLSIEEILGAIAVLHGSALWLAGVALRRGGVERREVRRRLLHTALSPFSSMVAVGAVARRLYGAFDPATLEALALEGGHAAREVRRRLHAIERALQADADTPRAPYWERVAAAHRRLLADVCDASAKPLIDRGAAAYCKVCDTGYREGVTRCAECGIPLQPFASASAD
jgi:hypothetical protein